MLLSTKIHIKSVDGGEEYVIEMHKDGRKPNLPRSSINHHILFKKLDEEV